MNLKFGWDPECGLEPIEPKNGGFAGRARSCLASLRNCLCGVFASSRGSRALDELWESTPPPELRPLTRNAASIST